jgi:hypothetical protein
MHPSHLKELELLIDRLHAIWAAGRDTPAKRREVKRLMWLCGDVEGVFYDTGLDPLEGWIQLCQQTARANPHDVHQAHDALEPVTHTVKRERKGNGFVWRFTPVKKPYMRPFPPAEAPAAARVCIDVIELLINARTNDTRHPAETEGSDYRRLAEFPRRYRDAIRKAAQRNKGVRRKRPPNQRAWLYCVPDVAAKHGDAARPLVMRGGTSKGPSGTTRDK